MARLTVPTTLCTLDYRDEPNDAFVAQFTAFKARIWSPIGMSIDGYIGQQVAAHITESSSIRRRFKNRNMSVHLTRLQALIDTEVNRGLAIVAHCPDVQVRSGPYQIVDTQAFESAIGTLLADCLGHSGRELRLRRVQSRHWVDACAYELTQAYFGGRIS